MSTADESFPDVLAALSGMLRLYDQAIQICVFFWHFNYYTL